MAFFDRERRAYRRAVREISEAMVSMPSAREVVDRILGALTETMGVERALVLLALQEGDGTLSVVATRGSWDEDAPEYRLGPNHPICRRLWMQRHELRAKTLTRKRIRRRGKPAAMCSTPWMWNCWCPFCSAWICWG